MTNLQKFKMIGKIATWAISGFLLLGLLASIGSPQIGVTVTVGVWLLLFLPPIYRLTSRYGLFHNIFWRIIVFLIAPVLIVGNTPPGNVVQAPQNTVMGSQKKPKTIESPITLEQPKSENTPSLKSSNSTKKYTEKTITASDFGNEWPLLVSKGIIRCDAPKIVTFITPDGMRYAVNGTATAFGHPEINPIWKDSPVAYVPKMNLSPLIDAGLKICADNN